MNTPAAETDPTLEELRIAALVRQAPLEFARVVYGLNDRANGRAGTMAAEDVARTERQGLPSRASVPSSGPAATCRWRGRSTARDAGFSMASRAPCNTAKRPTMRPESGSCKVCGAEYATSLD